MAWIAPFEANMDISRSINESRPSNLLLEIIQKITIYLVIPFMIIQFFEAVVKNLIFINLANLSIVILNTAHEAIYS